MSSCISTATQTHTNVSKSQPTNDPRIILIPWDSESASHVRRLKEQRVACGWNESAVEGWRDLQRVGKMAIHWLVLPATEQGQLNRHLKAFPSQAAPIQDTARTIFSRSRSHLSETELFIPIGHISLDSYSHKEELHLSVEDGTYSITTFYISKPLQSAGYGRAAMDVMERLAIEQFGAKTIAVDTISNTELDVNSPRRIALNCPPPKMSNEDWYTRRGYVAYAWRPNCYIDTDSTGKVWGATAVFMRKTL